MWSAFDCKGILGQVNKGLEFLYVVTITPKLVNHKAHTATLLLTREMFVSVCGMREETR
jgi:hypothetical protein